MLGEQCPETDEFSLSRFGPLALGCDLLLRRFGLLLRRFGLLLRRFSLLLDCIRVLACSLCLNENKHVVGIEQP